MLQCRVAPPEEWVGQWLVVCARPQGEEVANKFLSMQGGITYVPKFMRRRYHARKIDQVSTPLFPRYVLLADTGVLCAREIKSTFGVAGLVRFGLDLATVAGSVISGIRSREVDGFVQVPDDTEAVLGYTRGDPVRIVDGPMARLLGSFEQMRGPDRALVLMSYLGRRVPIEISLAKLERVTKEEEQRAEEDRGRARSGRRHRRLRHSTHYQKSEPVE